MTKLATDADYGSPHPLIAIVATGRWSWSRAASDVVFCLRATDGEVDALAYKAFDVLPGVAALVPPLDW